MVGKQGSSSHGSFSLDALWKDYFREPSLWHHNLSSSKAHSRSRHVRHRISHHCLFVDGSFEPRWVSIELQKRGGGGERRGEGSVHHGYKKSADTSYGKLRNEEGFPLLALLKDCSKQKDLQEVSIELQKRGGEGSVHHGYKKSADASYGKLRNEEGFLRLALLKDCSKQKDLQEDSIELQKRGGERRGEGSVHLGYKKSADVSYGKLRNEEGFPRLALLKDCSQQKDLQEASIELQKRVRGEGSVHHGYKKSYGKLRNEESFLLLALLKACSKKKDLQEGTRLHALVRENGSLQNDSYLATALISMYAKCGFVEMAQRLHDELPIQTVDSWNALISGYSRQGQDRTAMDRFASMQSHGFVPDEVTFICALKACSNMRSAVDGEKLHERIVHRSLLDSGSAKLGTALMDMYVKCGRLRRAQEVHEQLRVRDAFSWSVLITGFSQSGLPHEALSCFEQMQAEGLAPDAAIFTCILKACGSLGSIDVGTRIHDGIARAGLLEKDIMLSTALVDMYAKCGSMSKAKRVHDDLRARSAVSWSALIAGYAQQRKGHEALRSFERMRREGHSPDSITWICVLAACGSTGSIDVGRRIHGEIADRGLLNRDMGGLLGTALVDMYVQCGFLARARKAHECLSVRNVASWNALLAGFARHGHHREAAECFEAMRGESFSPDAITFTCMSKVYAGAGSVDEGVEIHGEAVARGLLKKDAELGDALVDMYARFGMLAKAEELHGRIRMQTIASWNALIAGYARHGRAREAFACFEKMQRNGVAPDEVTLTCILKVCSSTGAIEKGKRIHDEIARRGSLEKNVKLGTALMDMYLKCRIVGKAQEVHEQLCVRDVVSWSALIAGYAQQGQGIKALECFAGMQSEGVRADLIAFLSILNACNRTGLVDKATTYYCDMSSNHGIVPDISHHFCMVSIFACVGNFDQAVSIIRTTPSSRYPPLWLSLLGGCKRWGNVMLGKSAFDQLIQLDKSCAAAHVLVPETSIRLLV